MRQKQLKSVPYVIHHVDSFMSLFEISRATWFLRGARIKRYLYYKESPWMLVVAASLALIALLDTHHGVR